MSYSIGDCALRKGNGVSLGAMAVLGSGGICFLPPKAPANVADAKISATRILRSSERYQKVK